MSKSHVILTALLASSCCQAGQEPSGRSSEKPPLVIAAQSVSLEFPLQFSANDAPPGYIKVDAATSGNDAGWHLIDALVLCSPELVWIEKTSHTLSVIMPSQENAVWGKDKDRLLSDEDIIACIKETANQTFFYRKLSTGTQTYRRN